ncbi:hypothetical protein UUU_44560 [Klebsiella pneumoniae subsp. pneumoniae DSM 30104 = JCM 1662 = NBRC 14940]|nr:hypothetical protein UUU_44560 [Klebsiella pneumoniae subsp. pneumoniae DSM 30104 = JCM 1662 = NBRC 14940]
MPTTKAPTSTYGLFLRKSSGVVTPIQQSNTMATGTSKETPNAINSAITKSR